VLLDGLRAGDPANGSPPAATSKVAAISNGKFCDFHMSTFPQAGGGSRRRWRPSAFRVAVSFPHPLLGQDGEQVI